MASPMMDPGPKNLARRGAVMHVAHARTDKRTEIDRMAKGLLFEPGVLGDVPFAES